MLYVFHGTDIPSSQAKASTLAQSLRAKRPDAAFVHVTADDWHSSIIEEHLGGQGLFSNKYIVLIDRVTENSEAKETLPEFVESMKESTNIFILLEGKVLTDLKKKLDTYAEKIVVSDEKAAAGSFGSSGKNEFNIFALADAIGSRDSFKAWSIYRQAVEKGIEAESIIGTLFWQMKSIALSAEAKTAVQAGLSPFVFSKSQKYARNYSAGELNTLMGTLISVYHDSHRGLRDSELAVEKVLLGLGKAA